MAAPERIHRVQQNQVNRTVQACMLKPVIQKQDIEAESLLKSNSGLIAVAAYAYRSHRGPQEELRFVSGAVGIYLCSRR